MTQAEILEKIVQLGAQVLGLQAKADRREHTTYGGAMALQKKRRELRSLRGRLDPMKIVASGVSCRDCRSFGETETMRLCWKGRDAPTPTERMRAVGSACGPTAKLFRPHA